MRYFVTGSTGFIGRFLLAELLKHDDAIIYALVRPGSESRLQQIAGELQAQDGRIVPVHGNLTQPALGISAQDLAQLRGRIDHFFHLAAIYDLKNTDAVAQELSNVQGTRNAIAAAEAMQAGCFHHTSSIAVAGTYPGRFDESMFEQATGLDDPYFRTKHLAEKCVRDECNIPFRLYRPPMVAGHSQTGAMDKIDGPYFLFKIMQQLHDRLPRWFPLIGIEGGQFNIVPVDYVVQAMDVIAHQPGLDGQCFHLTAERHYTLGELLNLVAHVADAPTFSLQIPNRWIQGWPLQLMSRIGQLTPVQALLAKLLKALDLPHSALGFVTYPTTYDRSNTAAALAGSGIAPPLLEDYLATLWHYWSEHLDPDRKSRAYVQQLSTNTRITRETTMSNQVKFRVPKILPYFKRAKDHWVWNVKSIIKPVDALHDRVNGKVVLLTGASSGIGAQVAHKLANAGATLLLVARNQDKLEELAQEIRNRGGKAFIYPGNLTSMEDCDRICQEAQRDHGRVDILINNAGRSIRRSIKFTFDRFHDYERTMQLNYFGSIRMAMNLLPGMLERNDGHIINVSTVGVQANPARFSAYLASKWALEGWSWVAANEFAHTNVRFSTINYPLVRTPMIAPTKIYDYMPVMSPETAVKWMLDVIITQNKRKLGTMGKGALLMYYILPKTSESIVNCSYQTVYEQPPASYEAAKAKPVETASAADESAAPSGCPVHDIQQRRA